MMKKLIFFVFIVSAAAGPLLDYAQGHPYPYTGKLNKEGEATNYFPFERTCPDHCSGHGECIANVCECELGFIGSACETSVCPGNCSGKGLCLEGVCECLKGYTGRDCSVETCPNMCSNHGRCFQGDCYCDPNWKEIDCSVPKWGIPGLPRPLKSGIPESVRFNSSCMVFRVPGMLIDKIGPALSNASVTIRNNQSCVRSSMVLGGRTFVTSLEVSLEYPPERNLSLASGDNMVCQIFQGCDDVKLDFVYGEKRIRFINGIGVAPPLPPPPLPNQIPMSHCERLSNCSGRGVCVNVTLPVSRQWQVECACDSPFTPPMCVKMDRGNTAAPNTDPLWEIEPGQLPFNQIPCSKDDLCFACDQVLSDIGEWVPKSSLECQWEPTTSRCSVQQGNEINRHLTCRSSTIPDQLLPVKP